MEDDVLIAALVEGKSAKELPKIGFVSACLGPYAVRVNRDFHAGNRLGE
jgi:hypothetical protein